MGEYDRTYQRINELENEKHNIQAQIDALGERLYEINVEIGECEGYLAELRYIDGEDY